MSGARMIFRSAPVLASAAACLLAGSSAARTLEEIQFRPSPSHSEVVLVIHGMPDPRILELDFPPRIVLDLVGTRKTLVLGSQELAEGPIARVRVGQFAMEPVPITRIVADLRRSCVHELQWLEGGLALVLRDGPIDATLAANPVDNPNATRGSSLRSKDVLQHFLDTYDRDRERAMAILIAASSDNAIDFGDHDKLERVLDDVADYYAMQRPGDLQFVDLVLGLLDEGRIRLIVDQFYDRANRARMAPRTDAAAAGASVHSAAERYWDLYLLAVAAERRWRAPVELSIEDLDSEVVEGNRLSYAVTGKNRRGRPVTLPPNLTVQVVPPDAARHDPVARSIEPLRAGSFALRAGTANGALHIERQVLVQPAKSREVLVVSLSPGDTVMEVDEQVDFTVTANGALERIGWGVEWQPESVLSGLKTFEDGGKTVVSIHARQSGVGKLLVTGDGMKLAEANLRVLPPAPSKTVPVALSFAAAGALAGAWAAGETGNSDLQVWLGYGALPMLAISAAINWWRYREQGATREKSLEPQPVRDPSSAPVAAMDQLEPWFGDLAPQPELEYPLQPDLEEPRTDVEAPEPVQEPQPPLNPSAPKATALTAHLSTWGLIKQLYR